MGLNLITQEKLKWPRLVPACLLIQHFQQRPPAHAQGAAAPAKDSRSREAIFHLGAHLLGPMTGINGRETGLGFTLVGTVEPRSPVSSGGWRPQRKKVKIRGPLLKTPNSSFRQEPLPRWPPLPLLPTPILNPGIGWIILHYKHPPQTKVPVSEFLSLAYLTLGINDI